MVLLTLSDNELALVIEILVLVLPPPPPLPCSKGGGDRPKGSSRHPDTLSLNGVFSRLRLGPSGTKGQRQSKQILDNNRYKGLPSLVNG